MDKRHRLPVVVGAMAALAVVTTAVTASASSFPRVSKNIDITQANKSPVRNSGDPQVAVDPNDPNHIAVMEGDLRQGNCNLHISTDGGATFLAAKQSPVPPPFDKCTPTGATTPTQVVFYKNEIIVAMLVTVQACGTSVNGSVAVARTTDNGNSWQSTLVQDNRSSCTPASATANTLAVGDIQMIVDRTTNVVYVGWQQRSVKVQGVTTCTATSCSNTEYRSMVSSSTDGGATFSPGVDVEGDPTQTLNVSNSGPFMQVGPKDHNLYVFYTTGAAPKTAPSVLTSQKAGLNIAESTDHGKTFTNTYIEPNPPFYNYPFFTIAPHGSGQAFVIIYEGLAQGSAGSDLQLRDIYSQNSFDGKTWNSPVRVTDDNIGVDLGNKFVPGLGAAPNGRIDAAWADFRDDTGDFVSNTYYAYSNDGGTTWSPNIKISTAGSNRHYGQFDNYSDMRTQLRIASDNYAANIVWDDTRNATPKIDAQDTYYANVQFAALPATTSSTVARIIAAIAGGIIFAALVLIVAGLIVRNRRRAAVGARQGSSVS